MRICVIFNPVARRNKARQFRQHLGELTGDCAFKASTAAGDVRRLATESIAEGFEVIVAAGGDGTVNEVLNGIGNAPDGFEKTRLGVLPLGTMNVFARELKIPAQLADAWAMLARGNETKIDLGHADYFSEGRAQRRYFMQLAGVGLDARAIELVSWKLKKRIGPLAYVFAGLRALVEKQPLLCVDANGEKLAGELALFGNGKFYGGPFQIFPDGNLHDGRLDVCVFPKVNLGSLLRLAPDFVARRKLPEQRVRRLRAEQFTLTSDLPAAFELDGEWVGRLPVTFSVAQQKLRVIVP